MYWNALSYIEVADVAVLFFLQITISDLCTVTTLMPVVSFCYVVVAFYDYDGKYVALRYSDLDRSVPHISLSRVLRSGRS